MRRAGRKLEFVAFSEGPWTCRPGLCAFLPDCDTLKADKEDGGGDESVIIARGGLFPFSSSLIAGEGGDIVAVGRS